MLKSILRSNSKLQEYIYPPYRRDTNNNQENWEVSSIHEDGLDTFLHLKPLVKTGEHRTPPVKVLRRKVVFTEPLEKNESSKSKPSKYFQQSTAKKKTQGSGLNCDASGDAIINLKKKVSSDDLTQIASPVRWDFAATKWAARLEHLHEVNKESLKQLSAKSSPKTVVHFCDNQVHLAIGSGPDYSSIFLGIMNETTPVAVKKINAKRVPLLADEARLSALLALTSNPHFAKIHLVTRDKTHFYIVRDLCENSLKRDIRSRLFIPEEVRPPLDYVSLCENIAESVSALHKSGLAHLALKPENIFVEKSGNIKLADYSIHERSFMKKQQYISETTSLCWLPSEALGKDRAPELTQASDVASLGMIFCWLITGGVHPFGDVTNAPDACVKNIFHGHYNLKAVEDPFAHHLIQHMICKEPEKRMTMAQVLKHPYFWTNDVKVEYVKLLAKTISLICDAKLDDDAMCKNLIHFLKLKEAGILRSCSDPSVLEHFPKNARCNLIALIANIHHPMHGDNFELAQKVWRTLPRLALYMYGEFSSGDLKMLLMDIESLIEKRKLHLMLQTCLSADSGFGSPGTDFDSYHPVSFPFESESVRNRYDSECYASTDDGIDVLSPVCGSLAGDFVFSSPVKINPRSSKHKWELDSAEHSCSADKHFEFDAVDFPTEKPDLKPRIEIHTLLCTDMDELD